MPLEGEFGLLVRVPAGLVIATMCTRVNLAEQIPPGVTVCPELMFIRLHFKMRLRQSDLTNAIETYTCSDCNRVAFQLLR